jgi:hypothetical protein
MTDPAKVMIALGALSTVVIVTRGVFQVVTKYIETKRDPIGLSGGIIDERLNRIEQAVEAIAIEVERISEAQRFSAALLAERTPARQIGRESVTPH